MILANRIMFLFLMTILISSMEKEDKIVYKNEVPEFQDIQYKKVSDILRLNHSFVYEGSDKFPLYSVQSFLAFNDYNYLLDRVAHQVIKINNEGKKVGHWGREGRGPKEFSNAEHFISGEDSIIYVLDGAGNFRIHAFTTDGNELFAFPIRSFGPFSNSHLIEIDDEQLFITTTNAPCKDHANKSCILQVLDSEGNIVNSFGEINQIQPVRIGVSFHSTVTGEKIYVVHFLGDAIAVYDLNGNYKYHIPLQRSPHINLPDAANFPSDVTQQVSELNKSSYTSILGLFSNSNYLIVQYVRNGERYRDFPTRYFLDFYDFDGKPIYRGVDTQFPLMQVDENSFYFVGYDAGAQYGKVMVEKYIDNQHDLND